MVLDFQPLLIGRRRCAWLKDGRCWLLARWLLRIDLGAYEPFPSASPGSWRTALVCVDLLIITSEVMPVFGLPLPLTDQAADP